jgi:type VI protein secretion system component VasK
MNWIVLATLAGIILAFCLIRLLSIVRVKEHLKALKQETRNNRNKDHQAEEFDRRRLEAEMHIVKSIYRNKNIRDYVFRDIEKGA